MWPCDEAHVALPQPPPTFCMRMYTFCYMLLGIFEHIPLLVPKGGVSEYNVPNLVHSESQLWPDLQSLSEYTVIL